MSDFSGKTVLVTGGTSGIGLGVVRRFVQEGASVIVTGRRQEALEKVSAEFGSSVTTVQGDVSSTEDIARVFEKISELGTGIDVVFANAGGGSFAALGEISWEQFSSTFNANVGGVINTVQGALPFLSSGSTIVLTGSNIDVKASPSFSVYAASKAAVRSLARSWAVELIERGIRVNVVAPGPIGTPGLSGLAGGPEQSEALFEGLAAGVPMRRLGTEDEIADAVLYLASKQSSYVTGSILYVDGGASQI